MARADGVIERFITTDGTLRLSAVICTKVIEETRNIHNSFPVATAALGRSLIGAGLLASFLKNKGRIGLYFKGDGPLGPVFAEGDFSGQVRGFASFPQIHLPSKSGKLDVGGAVGKGVLSVATSTVDNKKPYIGTVPLQSGEIGDDIAHYLFQSQQVPSVVALGVFIEADNSVGAAGGTILQAMPGVKEITLKTLEERVKQMHTVTELIKAGGTTSDLAYEVLEDFNFRKLDERTALQFACHCSSKRVERSLLLLGEVELQALVDRNIDAEVNCDFCGRKYLVDLNTLKGLLSLSKKRV